jgi:multidrug efflux pump subunit AcrB/outer membrane protein TolC
MSSQVLKYKRIFLSFFTLLALSGLASWFTMPKEEDPQLKERFGNIQVIYPGATPKEMERLVINPLVEGLSEISEVKKADATIRSEFGIIEIEFTDSTDSATETNEAWTDIQNLLTKESAEFPKGVLSAKLDRKALDQDAIVLAIKGEDLLAMQEVADSLEKQLLQIPTVSKVQMIADPGKQVSITLDEDKVRRLGLDRTLVISQIQRANVVAPGGSIKVGQKKVNISTNSSFENVADIANLSIIQPSGSPLKLSDIAEVKFDVDLPREEAMRVNGKTAIGLGIVPSREIDLIAFGDQVRETVSKFQKQNENHFEFEYISFQPENVSSRLADLGFSLLIGILTVSVLLIALMGVRVGLITSLLVPVICLAALSVYALTGGVLHQISISAFVLSLGLLVDNIIVVIEAIQNKRDHGVSPTESASSTLNELAIPLLAATGTTVASFIPMLGSTGSTADFTRAIPTIAVLTLSISYLFSVFVTPALGEILLKPSKTKTNAALNRVGNALASWVLRRPIVTLAATFALLGASGASSGLVKQKFFPNADRTQLVLEVRFSEGTHYQYTNEKVMKLEQEVIKQPGVVRVSTFVGRSTPRFFYNLNRIPNAPSVSQLIVEYKDIVTARDSLMKLERLGEDLLPEAFVIARPLEQGPPTLAPVEIQVLSSNFEDVVKEYQLIMTALQETPGTRKVRADIGTGLMKYQLETNDFNAGQYFLSRSDLAATTLSKTNGIPVGKFRAGDDTDVFIKVRSPEGQYTNPEQLANTFVGQTETSSVDIRDFAQLDVIFEPSVLRKRKSSYIVRVLSEVQPGYDFKEILTPALARIDRDLKNPNVQVRLGGAAEESDTANTAIFKVMPIGVMLLLISLLVQFNSFRKVTIILFTIPLIFAGVFPALLLAGQPFSFFSLLGVLALIGIVVNTGILLVDRIDNNLARDLPLGVAVTEAITRRLRPILLTTITTVAGLLPLALTSATLWPPFAWAMIGGLIASTLLALVVVPSLYILILKNPSERLRSESKMPTQPSAAATTLGVLLMVSFALFQSPRSQAETLDLSAVVSKAEQRAAYLASTADVTALKKQLEAQRGNAYLPKVSGQIQRFFRDRNFELETPVGAFEVTEQWNTQAAVVATQSLLDLENMEYRVEGIKHQLKGQKALNARLRKQVKVEAANAYLDILILEANLETSRQLTKNLENRRRDINRLFDLGRVSRLDKEKINIAIDESEQQEFAIAQQMQVLKQQLGQFIGVEGPVEVNSNSLASFQSQLTKKTAAPERRLDLQALGSLKSAKEQEMAQTRSAYLPKVSLQGRYIHDIPGQFRQTEWYEVGLIASWEIFSGNTRYQKLQATKAEYRAASLREKEAERAIQVEQTKASADLNTLEKDKLVRDRSYSRARSVIKAERQRYQSGKATLNDLIDAELLLTQTKGKISSYPFELLKQRLKLLLANEGQI